MVQLVSISALGVNASATYVLTYVVATLVAFAVVAVTLNDRPADGRNLTAYEGLWRRSPWRAGALAGRSSLLSIDVERPAGRFFEGLAELSSGLREIAGAVYPERGQ